MRRKTNSELTELKSLRQAYQEAKTVLDKAEAALEHESLALDSALASLEGGRNALSEVQAEVDADYLPEGAQPRVRIAQRDKLLLVRATLLLLILPFRPPLTE